jgi:hypothetical protein
MGTANTKVYEGADLNKYMTKRKMLEELTQLL